MKIQLACVAAAVAACSIGANVASAAAPDTVDLTVNTITGEIRLVGNDSDPAELTGYDVTSDDGSLSPAEWMTLASQGQNSFITLAASPTGVSEGSLTGQASIDLTGFSLGSLFAEGTGTFESIAFAYTDENGDATIGNVINVTPADPIPEPTALALLGLGGVGLLARRRRA